MKIGDVIKRSKNGNGFKDLTGMRFNRLTVIEHLGSQITRIFPTIKYKSYWKCICDCGGIVETRGNSLLSGSKSCGCYSSEIIIEFNKRTKTKLTYDTFGVVLQSYKQGAKRRGLSFKLTTDQFYHLTQQNCHYCDQEPRQIRKARVRNKLSSFYYNGIDRTDSELGYNMGNCVSCCKHCNYIKRDMSYDDFKIHIKKIHSHLKL